MKRLGERGSVLVEVMAPLVLSIVAIGIVMAATGESRSSIKNQSDYGGLRRPTLASKKD